MQRNILKTHPCENLAVSMELKLCEKSQNPDQKITKKHWSVFVCKLFREMNPESR